MEKLKSCWVGMAMLSVSNVGSHITDDVEPQLIVVLWEVRARAFARLITVGELDGDAYNIVNWVQDTIGANLISDHKYRKFRSWPFSFARLHCAPSRIIEAISYVRICRMAESFTPLSSQMAGQDAPSASQTLPSISWPNLRFLNLEVGVSPARIPICSLTVFVMPESQSASQSH